MNNKWEKESKPVTMEEMVAQHDEWWNSLSDKDKELIKLLSFKYISAF